MFRTSDQAWELFSSIPEASTTAGAYGSRHLTDSTNRGRDTSYPYRLSQDALSQMF